MLSCTDQVCVKCAHTYTESPWTKSSGRSFSRFCWIQTSSCFISPRKQTHTHTNKAHTQTDNRGYRLGVMGQGARFQPPGRCDATEAPGGTKLCICLWACIFMSVCVCLGGKERTLEMGEGLTDVNGRERHCSPWSEKNKMNYLCIEIWKGLNRLENKDQLQLDVIFQKIKIKKEQSH